MKKSQIITDLLGDETEEEKNERILRRKNYIEKHCESYYLGYLVGEKISPRLPILSTSGVKGNIPIQIGELDNYNKLNEQWFDEEDEVKQKKIWKEMTEYRHMLEDKYLPKEFSTNLMVINVKNMDDFKFGIQTALWNSDFCYYDINSINDFEVTIDEDYYFMNFKFKREK
jgi:hypothetical protein